MQKQSLQKITDENAPTQMPREAESHEKHGAVGPGQTDAGREEASRPLHSGRMQQVRHVETAGRERYAAIEIVNDHEID